MGFLLRLFGIFITAIALLSTAHLYGWLGANDILNATADIYGSFVRDVLFFPAQALPEMFELTFFEQLIITLIAILIYGPGSLGILTIDYDFNDSGPGGLIIARVMIFLITLTVFALIAGLMPTPITLLTFGGVLVTVTVYYLIRAYAWPFGTVTGPDIPLRRARFISKHVFIFLGTAAVFFALDAITTLEDGCINVAGRCLYETTTRSEAPVPDDLPQDGSEPPATSPEDPPQ